MFSQHPTNTKRSSVMRSIYLFGLVVCTLNSLEDRIVSVEYFFYLSRFNIYQQFIVASTE